jgi:ABC-2 type transport system permease protein
MSTATLPLPVRRSAPRARHPGLAPARLVARGARRGALIWGAVFGLITWAEASQFAAEYPSAADRTRLVNTMGNNIGLDAIFGPSPRIDTIGGYVATHAVGVLGIIGAIWGLLAATRLLRGEEDAGRSEGLLSGVTTRRRAVAMQTAGLGVGLLILWTVTAAGYLLVGRATDAGFSVTASLYAATATVAAAAVFLAVGALASQLAASRRQAAMLATVVFGAAYLLRVVAYSSGSLRWLHWVSPLGWVDELRPLTGSHPLVLVPIGLIIAVLVAATIILGGRRDLGAGLLPAYDVRASHIRWLSGPTWLAHRLGRGTMYAWMIGLAVGGLLLGLIAKGSADLWANQPGGLFVNLVGATGAKVYLGITFLLVAFLVTMAAAGQVAAIREDEAEGYLDYLLARPVARLRWLADRVAVSAAHIVTFGVAAGLFVWIGAASTGAGLSLTTLLAAGLNVVPAGILVLGIGVLAHGLVPRLTAPVAYGVVAWSFLVEIVGAGIGASHWLLDTSVLHHIARAPATAVRWDAAGILVAVGLIAGLAGALAFAHRDLKGA